LTIVSSLDPCAMCAGAIMRSGMRVIAIAEDNEAGVHEALKPVHMPPELQALAERRMAFFGIRGSRPQAGGIGSSVLRSPIAGGLAAEARGILLESLDEVRRTVGGSDQGSAATGEFNTGTLKQIGPIIERLSRTLKAEKAPMNILNGDQRSDVLQELTDDRCALVDDHGDVIFSAKGTGDDSSAQTSVLEVVRNYNLIRAVSKHQLDISLPPPRSCSIVKRRAQENPATALMELGALGSFIEEPRAAEKLPAMVYLENENIDRVESWTKLLPPFYVRVGITVGLVSSS
jgi:hypothetical protein